MTDKEYKFEKARIERFLKKWKAAGFGWFHITNRYHRERKDGELTTTAAEITAKWQYKKAWIDWYLPMFEGQTDDYVEDIVVHELCHVLTSPLQDFSDDDRRQMTEYSTSLVADALLWAAKMKVEAAE